MRKILTKALTLTATDSASLQAAVNYVCNGVDVAGHAVVIQCADGTYRESVHLGPVVGCYPMGGHTELTIRGGTLGNVLFDTPGACFAAVNCWTPWRLEGFEFRSATAHAVIADFHARIYVGRNRYGACGVGHLVSAYGSSIEVVDDYEISGGGMFHWVAGQGSRILCTPATVLCSGAPTFSQAFAYATDNASIQCPNVSFVNGVVGARFYIGTGGGVQTSTGDLNYLPGSIAGTCISPGWYG